MTVPSDPNLTRQPSTFDSRVEVEDDAPRAQGHDEDRAAEVKEAVEQHKATVDAEADQPDVGARAPGDHAEKTKKKSEKD